MEYSFEFLLKLFHAYTSDPKVRSAVDEFLAADSKAIVQRQPDPVVKQAPKPKPVQRSSVVMNSKSDLFGNLTK